MCRLLRQQSEPDLQREQHEWQGLLGRSVQRLGERSSAGQSQKGGHCTYWYSSGQGGRGNGQDATHLQHLRWWTIGQWPTVVFLDPQVLTQTHNCVLRFKCLSSNTLLARPCILSNCRPGLCSMGVCVIWQGIAQSVMCVLICDETVLSVVCWLSATVYSKML